MGIHFHSPHQALFSLEYGGVGQIYPEAKEAQTLGPSPLYSPPKVLYVIL